MTQDEIAEMYQKANGWNPSAYSITMAELEAFAKLVAAKEREACAKVAESFGKYESDVADAIRARGEA